ncbi:MAG: electron transfer flavoprotein subunit beta/FixA family protein [Planctomycetota bacterium]
MKAIVCMKRVPDTEAKLKIRGTGIERAGFEYVINPYDEYAIEQAIQVKEKVGGDSEVVILSIGPKETATQIRKALSMGADRGVLLTADIDNLDAQATAEILATALKEMEYDIIFFGKQGVDNDNASVGVQVAQHLGLPVVSTIVEFELKDGAVVVEREVEGAKEVIEVKLPAVFTAEKGLNEPRYPKLPDIMKAKKKPLEEKEAPAIESKTTVVKMEYPPARPPGRIVGKGVEAVPELVKLLKEEAKVI